MLEIPQINFLSVIWENTFGIAKGRTAFPTGSQLSTSPAGPLVRATRIKTCLKLISLVSQEYSLGPIGFTASGLFSSEMHSGSGRGCQKLGKCPAL